MATAAGRTTQPQFNYALTTTGLRPQSSSYQIIKSINEDNERIDVERMDHDGTHSACLDYPGSLIQYLRAKKNRTNKSI